MHHQDVEIERFCSRREQATRNDRKQNGGGAHHHVWGGKYFSERGRDSLTGFIYTSDPARVFASRNVRNLPNRLILTRWTSWFYHVFRGKNDHLLYRRIVADAPIISNIIGASDVMVSSIFRTKRSSWQLTVTN